MVVWKAGAEGLSVLLASGYTPKWTQEVCVCVCLCMYVCLCERERQTSMAEGRRYLQIKRKWRDEITGELVKDEG